MSELTEPPDDRQRLEALTVQNNARIAALATRGIMINQDSLDRMRLGFLIEHLMPEHSGARWAFEMNLQSAYAARLDEIESQAQQQLEEAQAEARKQTLLQGVVVNRPRKPNEN